MKLFFTLFIIYLFSITLLKADYDFTHNEKAYRIITEKKTWQDAVSHAVSLGGYLVEINDEDEQNAVWDAIKNGAKISVSYGIVTDGGGVSYVWIGANDKNEEGKWLWDGDNDGEGINFWNGQGDAGNKTGVAVDNAFNNWGGKIQYGFAKEPDDFQGKQDAAAIALSPWPLEMGFLGKASEWNDISETNQLYFVVEFDGATGVNSDKSNIDIEIFPNPANDYIELRSTNFDFSPFTIKIIDYIGQEYKISSYSIDMDTVKLHFEGFTSGTYYVILENGQEKITKSFSIIK